MGLRPRQHRVLLRRYAARSMAMSWHNFFFGAADPWATISVDKIPGALWIQALSLRLFGFHVWALVLPQVVEGVLTVLVLYRAVRRVAGAGAGLAAAIVLAGSPVVILLNRGNISDSLLLLLLVLAADATIRACQTGRLRSLLWAGVLVGFAFQAKMLQAWLVVPALFLAYLVAAPVASFLRRVGHLAASSLAVLIVSLSWMSTVSLFPESGRPYVDGSCNDSLFSQVFLYNASSRISYKAADTAGCIRPSAWLTSLGRYSASEDMGTSSISASWTRLLHGAFGHDAAWLLLPAVVSIVWLLLLDRGHPRTDLRRAAVDSLVGLVRADVRLLQPWPLSTPTIWLPSSRPSPRCAAWVHPRPGGDGGCRRYALAWPSSPLPPSA